MAEASNVFPLDRPTRIEATGSFSAVADLLRDPVMRERALGRRGELELNLMGQYPMLGGVRLDDSDLLHLRESCERFFRRVQEDKETVLHLSSGDAADVVRMVASEHRVHPVTRYLDALVREWDGVDRIPGFCAALGVDASPLNHRLLYCFLLMAANRGRSPGAKADNVLTLVGPQGFQKSTAMRELFGADLFSDSEVRPGSKDSYMVAAMCWGLEWGELSSMRTARDVEQVKAFLSAQEDTFRPPYSRDVVRQPRTAVIVATTNDDEFLQDPTGNRRFWPLRVERNTDPRWLRANRDQVWAQAVHFRISGTTEERKYWLTPDEDQQLRALHKGFEPTDAWADLIEQWLACPAAQMRPWTTATLLEEAIKKPPGQWSKGDEMRVGRAMRSLGYRKDRTGPRSERQVLWCHTSHTSTSAGVPPIPGEYQ